MGNSPAANFPHLYSDPHAPPTHSPSAHERKSAEIHRPFLCQTLSPSAMSDPTSQISQRVGFRDVHPPGGYPSSSHGNQLAYPQSTYHVVNPFDDARNQNYQKFSTAATNAYGSYYNLYSASGGFNPYQMGQVRGSMGAGNYPDYPASMYHGTNMYDNR